MSRRTRSLGRAAAAVLASLVALLPPVGYFLLSYQYLIGTLDSQADLSARTVTQLVMANPRTWQFEELRLSELLQRRPLTRALQVRRIVDSQGRLVAQFRDRVDRPWVTRSQPVYDAGYEVGNIEVVQSLRPLVNRSAFLGAASVVAGLVLYLAVGVYPQRVAEKALASLEESERRYRLLYRSMKEGMALFRISGAGVDGVPSITLLDVNPALEAMLGVGAAELLGNDGAEFLGGSLVDHLPAIALGAKAGEPVTFEVAPPRRSRVYSVSVFYPEPGLFSTLIEDLTVARRAREEREFLERKMLQAQKLESLGVLAGGIAHDFNNLLVGILGNVDLALAKSTPESVARPYLQRIETAAQRAADLTNQMLAYSGRGRFVIEPIEVSRLVGEMGQLLATVVSKTAVLRQELADGLSLVEGDATQIRQVVMNMITNASDAMGGREGVITVATGAVEADRGYLVGTYFGESLPEGPYVYIEVSDTGCGMDDETRGRIFDPFFTTKETGRGLGLAAALGIVRGHRGTLSVRSEPGAGTSFRVLFPALRGEAGERAAGPSAAAPEHPAPAGGTILVVDDEEEVREVARAILEEQGFGVLTAADGREGVELLRQRRRAIVAVLLDMTMPRMGGGEALRAMQQIAPEVPVVLCSGYPEQDAAGLAAGLAFGFVQKPFRGATLVAKLRGAIEQRCLSVPSHINRL